MKELDQNQFQGGQDCTKYHCFVWNAPADKKGIRNNAKLPRIKIDNNLNNTQKIIINQKC